jgi:hypothetical protein
MKTNGLHCYNLVKPKLCDARHKLLAAENNFPKARKEQEAARKRGPHQCRVPGSKLKLLFSVQRLPAAVSAATTITAVTVPASATASTAATTTARSSSATAEPASSTTAARSPTTPATAAFTRGPSFVDDDIAAHEIVTVQTLDGALGFLVAVDFDESESSWLPRKTVAHQGNIRRSDSSLSK